MTQWKLTEEILPIGIYFLTLLSHSFAKQKRASISGENSLNKPKNQHETSALNKKQSLV